MLERMDLSQIDLADFLDNLTPDAVPPGWLDSLRLVLDSIEEQRHAATVASADKLNDEAEDVSGDFLYCVFDQRMLLNRPKRKWYKSSTTVGDRTGSSRLTKKRGLCFHHTAVRGGFGADRSMIARYSNELKPNVDAHGLLDDAAMHRHFKRFNRALTHEEGARALALAARYRGEPPREYNNGVPYHALLAANSVLYLNLPFDFVTWHGNGANNDFLGVGWDALSTAEAVAPIADDLIADVETVIKIARDEGHPIDELTTHSVWTNKPTDPDAEFIRLVMEPAAKAFRCYIDYDRVSDHKGARSIRQTLAAA